MATNLQSPCVRNCCLNEADICLGCFRSLAEIAVWSSADDQLKTQILTQAGLRRSRVRHKSLVDGDDTDLT